VYNEKSPILIVRHVFYGESNLTGESAVKLNIWKILSNLLLLLFIASFSASGFMLIRYYYDANQTASSFSHLKGAMPTQTPRPSPTASPSDTASNTPKPTARVSWEIDERFEALYEQNDELAGWITIEGTNIDYPVVQSSKAEPEKYLDTGFDGSHNSNGVPFLDSRCKLTPNSSNMIIYGHNMKSKIMFHHLTSYSEQSFWEEHQYILFDTIYGEGTYQIAAAYIYSSADAGDFKFHEHVDFNSEKVFDEYMAEVLSLRLYDTGVELRWGDELLTLATCEYSTEDGRFVLLAKKVD